MEATIARRAGEAEVVDVPRGLVNQRRAVFAEAQDNSPSTSTKFCYEPTTKTKEIRSRSLPPKAIDIEVTRVHAPAQITRVYPDEEVVERRKRVVVTRHTLNDGHDSDSSIHNWHSPQLSNRHYPVVTVNMQKPAPHYEPKIINIPVQRSFTSSPVRPDNNRTMAIVGRDLCNNIVDHTPLKPKRHHDDSDFELKAKEAELREAERNIERLTSDLHRLEHDKARLLSGGNDLKDGIDDSQKSGRKGRVEAEKIIEDCGRIMETIKRVEKEEEEQTPSANHIGDSSKILSVKEQTVMYQSGPTNRQEALISRLQQELTDAQHCNHRLNSQLATLAAGSTATLKREITDMKKDLRERQSENELLRKKLQKMEQERQHWDTQKKQLESKLPMDVQLLMAQKRELTMQLDREQNEKQELFMQINSMIAQLADCGDVKVLKEENKALKDQIQEIKETSNTQRIREVQRMQEEADIKMRTLQAEKRQMESQIEQSQRELQMKTAALESLMLAKDSGKLEKLTEENRKLTENVSALQEQLERTIRERQTADRSEVSSLQQQLTDVKGQLKDLEASISQERTLKESLRIQLTAAEAKATESEAKIKESEEKLRKVEEGYRQAGAGQNAEMDEIRTKLANVLKEKQALNDEFEAMKESLEVHQTQLSETSAKLDAARVSQLAAESRAIQADEDLKAAENQVKASERRASQLQSQLDAAGNDNKEIEILRVELKKAEDRLQETQNSAQDAASAHRKQIEELEERLISSNKEKETLDSEIEKLKIERQKLESKASVADEITTLMGSLTSLRAENSQYQQELNNLHEKLNQAKDELEQSQAENQELRLRFENLQQDKDEVCAKMSSELDHLHQKHAHFEKEIGEKEKSLKLQHQVELEQLHEQLELLQTKHTDSNSQHETLQKRVQELENELKLTANEKSRVEKELNSRVQSYEEMSDKHQAELNASKESTVHLQAEIDKLKGELMGMKQSADEERESGRSKIQDLTDNNQRLEDQLRVTKSKLEQSELGLERLRKDLEDRHAATEGEVGELQNEKLRLREENINLAADIERITNQRLEVEERLSEQRIKHEEERKSQAQKISDLESDVIRLEELNSALQTDLQQHKRNADRLVEEHQSSCASAREKHEILVKELDQLKSQYAKLLEVNKQTSQELTAENEKIEEQLQQAQQDLQSLRNNLHDAEDTIEELRLKHKELEEEIVNLESEIAELSDEKNSLMTTGKAMKERLASLERDEEQQRLQVAQLKKQLIDIQTEYAEARSLLHTTQSSADKMRDAESMAAKITQQLQELDEEKNLLVQKHEDEKAELQKLVDELKSESARNAADSAREHGEKLMEMKRYNDEITEKHLHESRTLNDKIQRLENKLVALTEDRDNLRKELEDVNQKTTDHDVQLKLVADENALRSKNLEGQLEAALAEKEDIFRKVANLQEAIEVQALSHKEELDRQLTVTSNLEAERNELKQKLKDGQTKHAELETSLIQIQLLEKEIAELRAQRDESETQKRRLEELEEEREKLERKTGDMETKLAASSKAQAELLNNVRGLTALLETESKRVTEMAAEKKKWKDKSDELERQLDELKTAGPDEKTSELISENARLAGELLKARSSAENALEEERQQNAKLLEDRIRNINMEKEKISNDLAAAKSRIEELNRTIVQTEKKRKDEVASIYTEMDIVKSENSRLQEKIDNLSSNGHPVAPPRRVSNMSSITNFTNADFSEIDDLEVLRSQIDKQRRLIIVLRRKLQGMQ